MITKERLEELIKQGGEVYDEVKDKLIKLNKKTCHLVMSYPSKDIDMLEIKYKVGKYEYHYVDHYIANLTDDTNDIERAKNEIERLNWERKTYTERTERFEPPMWDEIKNYYDFRFVVNNKCLRLYVRKDVDCIVIFTEDDDRIFEDDATKENYEKACRIVRDLFKGEK